MENSIQKAIDAIDKVLNIHENHLYPTDTAVFSKAIKCLKLMKEQGFN